MDPIEAAAYLDSQIKLARLGSKRALQFCRESLKNIHTKAPDDEMLEIADFCNSLLKRHILNHCERN